MDLGLDGKTALVTGSSKGIGRAVADALAAEGCHLRLAARTETDLAAAADAIRGRHNVNVTIHPVDLSTSAGVDELGAACGDVDILINNAGAIPSARFSDLDEAAWRAAWDLKYFGYINLTRHIYGAMKERRAGVIVNVIGNAAGLPRPAYIAGGAANRGLGAFSVALGKESPEYGIRVVALHPGVTRTERQAVRYEARAAEELGDASRWAELLPPLPFGRPTEPEEVADFVIFLASDRCGYTSGVEIDNTPSL